MMIEVEIRSLISDREHGRLLSFFRDNARFVKSETQETLYLDTEADLRIQRTDSDSKIWMKKGAFHDEAREEIKVRFHREDFEGMVAVFLAAGIGTSVKWMRERHIFDWKGVTVCIDDTKGYGKVIELEVICDEGTKEIEIARLKRAMGEIGIKPTPREEFDRMLQRYKSEWRSLGI